MPDPRTVKLAHILCDYCLDLKPGQQVLFQGTTLAEPLVTALYERALERGAHPVVQLQIPGLPEIFFRKANDAQLDHISPIFRMVIETFDAVLSIFSQANTRALTNVDPARMARAQVAESALMGTFFERSARGELAWNGCQYPTNAHAQEADMSLREYEDFVYSACLVDDPDPVARWKERHAQQQHLVDWLKGKERVEVHGPHCDLRLSIAGRVFDNDAGRANMPGGEIYTSPVEDSVEGWIEFSFPAIYGGREVDNVRLTFEHGQVVAHSATKGEDFLTEMLNSDPGARRLGEFAIGNNWGIQRFTKNMLFDEKIGGTIHCALGRGFPETGSKNESGLHWDMLCDMRDGGTITADGVKFYDAGKFLV